MTYKVLTLHQPWASAMFTPLKRIETRSWLTRHRGKLLIHAAATMPRYAKEFSALLSPEIRKLLPDPLPLGVILGEVEHLECRKTERCSWCCGAGFQYAHPIDRGPCDQAVICGNCGGAGWHPERVCLTEREALFGQYKPGPDERARYGWLNDPPAIIHNADHGERKAGAMDNRTVTDKAEKRRQAKERAKEARRQFPGAILRTQDGKVTIYLVPGSLQDMKVRTHGQSGFVHTSLDDHESLVMFIHALVKRANTMARLANSFVEAMAVEPLKEIGK